MKKIITCLVFLLFHYLSGAQSPSSFYLDEITTGGAAVYTPDNIYFENNTKLIKTDYQGNVIWSKDDMPRNPIFQGDVFYGYSYIGNNFYISKCDTSGNYIWTKDISQTVCPLVSNHYNTMRGMFVNQDRIYITSGQYSSSMGYDGSNALVALDTSGNVVNSWCDPSVWPMTLTYIATGYPSFLPGGWISFTSGGVGQEITLVKIDHNGAINTSVPAIQIDMGISVFIDQILMLHDSTYLAVCRIDNNQMGNFHDDFFGLSKFTENGSVLWQKVYQTQGDTGVGCSGAVEDSLGNIYVIGGLFNYTYRSMLALKLDQNGDVSFAKEWNDSSITIPLEQYRLTLKDNHLCCGAHYINGAQKHEGMIVFDTLFSSCFMNGVPYNLMPGPNPIYYSTWQLYNPIAYATIPYTLTPTNLLPSFPIDLCSVLTEVPKMKSASEINLYPNPFESSIVLDENYKAYVKIFDLTGKQVFEKHLQGKSEIDLGFLPRGIYQLTYFTESKTMNRKIVKM